MPWREVVIPWSEATEAALGDPEAWRHRHPRHAAPAPGERACPCEDCASRYGDSDQARRELEAWLTEPFGQLALSVDQR